MKRRFIALSMLLTAAIATVGAQQTQPQLPINLGKAIEIALTDNPTIMIADKEIQRQHIVRKTTKGGLLPTLSASGSYTYNLMNPVMFLPSGAFGPGSGGAMRMGFSNGFTGGGVIALPVYMPTLYRTLDLNEEQLMNAVESARSSKISLVNQVKKSYYTILLGETSLEVIRTNIEYAKIVVDNTRKALEQGTVSEYDLITAEVQLRNLDPTFIQTQNAIRVSRLTLNMLLSLPLDTYLQLAEELYDYATFINSNPDHTIDLSGNADLNLIEIQRRILEKQLHVQKALRLPTLNATLQYQTQTQSNTLQIGTYDWRGSSYAGLQLAIPIFSGFTKKNKELDIKNSIEQVSMQGDYLNESVNVEAQTAVSNITRAKEQMDANIIARTQAQKGYKIAKTRYDTGAGTIVELNSAQMALLQSELNYTQSIFDYMSSQADFDKVTGKIN